MTNVCFCFCCYCFLNTKILQSKARITVSLFFRRSFALLPQSSALRLRDFTPSSKALGSAGLPPTPILPPFFRSSELGARAAHVESITRLDQYSPIIRSSLLAGYFRLLPSPNPFFSLPVAVVKCTCLQPSIVLMLAT